MLVTIEGLPGSGKTSTAQWLSKRLENTGLAGTWWHEGCSDNPIGLPWSYEEARNTIAATTPEKYPFHSWTTVPSPEHDFAIIEAKFLQSTSAFSLLQGKDKDTLSTFPKRILSEIGARPFKLIVLDVFNPRKHLLRTLDQRRESHPDWLAFVKAFFSEQPWCRQRKLDGELAFVEAMSAWHTAQAELLPTLNCQWLKIAPFHLGWEQAHEAIWRFVRD